MKNQKLLYATICCLTLLSLLFLIEIMTTKPVVIYTTNDTELINAYEEYYENTEAMLDSLVDCDDTILETDLGSSYLNAKFKVDSLITLPKK